MELKLDFTLNLPNDVHFLKTMAFIIVFSMAVFFIAALARAILGKDSSLKHCLASSLAIIMLYAICVVIYIFSPRDFSAYINSLPMGTFSENVEGQKIFVLHTWQNLNTLQMCQQILRVYLMAVLVNWICAFTPDKLKRLGWITFRIICLGVAIGIHYALCKVINMFIPFIFKGYAPMLLLAILAFCFVLAFLKYVLTLMVKEINGTFTGMHGFFFKNKLGLAMSRGVGSTIVIIILVMVFEHLGYVTLPISPGDLDSYIPFALSMFILWFLVGNIL